MARIARWVVLTTMMILFGGAALAGPGAPRLRVEQQLRWAGEVVVASDPGGAWVWSTGSGEVLNRLPPTDLLVVSRDGRWIATDQLLFRVGIEAPVLAWPEARAAGFDEDLAWLTVQHLDGSVDVRRLPAVSASAGSP